MAAIPRIIWVLGIISIQFLQSVCSQAAVSFPPAPQPINHSRTRRQNAYPVASGNVENANAYPVGNANANAYPVGNANTNAYPVGNANAYPVNNENAYPVADKIECQPPWTMIGARCIFVDPTKSTTFDGGRSFCRQLKDESDLATLRDANEFQLLLQHLRSINSDDRSVHFWIGGRDEGKNNIWTWVVDGQPMPMGSPFWGVSPRHEEEPVPHIGEYCTILYQQNRYYIHNFFCDGLQGYVIAPICQYNPIFTVIPRVSAPEL